MIRENAFNVMNQRPLARPKARIMIVEDEFIVALDEEKLLQSWGYDVVAVAHSGEEAIEKAFQTSPDLVLMDIRITGLINDGVEAAKYLNERTNLPVIFLTAMSDEITQLRANYAKPAGYITKPFNEDELSLKIAQVLGQRSELKGDDSSAPAGSTKVATVF
jgi:CheY-like chemotaxis protein